MIEGFDGSFLIKRECVYFLAIFDDLMQNLKLNTIEVTLVGAFVQIVLSGLFVSFFQCHRLWSAPPAGTNLRPIGKKILWICTLEHFFMFIYC